MDYASYTNPDTWIGGFYELSIEYYPFGNNKRVHGALTALCNSDHFNGVWEDKKDYQMQSISLPIHIDEDSVIQLYGTLTLTLSHSIELELPCLVTVVRVDGKSDWLDVAIPQAAFEKIFPYKYPLTLELNPWLQGINELYTQLAEIIYCGSPFDFAMIGEEISGYTNQEDLTDEVVQSLTCILPCHLRDRLGLEGKGKELSNELLLFD